MSTSKSGIEWTGRTWNPTRGCRRISPGCENCYAERQAARFCGGNGPFAGFVRIGKQGPRWTGEAMLVEHALREPLTWRKPALVFVDSMSDLFYDGFTDEQIAHVFAVMAATPQHTYQVLTKRADRLPRWFKWAAEQALAGGCTVPMALADEAPVRGLSSFLVARVPWPLPNVWIGVSVEDQQRADERLPHLLATPAAVRFVSYEPALTAVDFRPWLRPRLPGDPPQWKRAVQTPEGPRDGIDWLIVGGESGPGARPFDLAWARDAVTACKAAGAAVFVKQLGARPRGEWGARKLPQMAAAPRSGEWVLSDRKGGDLAEWPEDLRVREMPETQQSPRGDEE